MTAPKKRKIYKANPYERKILQAIFFYATLPMLVVIIVFFSMFSDMVYSYLHSDLGGRFLERFWIVVGLMCVYYIIFARMVFRFANRLAGAYPRIIREIDEILNGKRPKKHIHLREGDYSQELIAQVNRLIDQFR